MAVQDKARELASGGDVAKSILAVGGLLAAFGVASCCALPIALSMLGISAAFMVGIGYLAAQYQQELFYGAVLLLVSAAFVMWRQRRMQTCRRPALDWTSRLAVALAAGLLALTFWIEPPV